ncbi:MAG: UvrD-helicase domain-containing protein, partial [Caldilineaceae bacterium]|nr:UvrD-helicase domain-containing protein [Caldilineaceae bacterium]
MSRLLQGLNPQQRQAVETTEGPVLVLAGPGSGKTRVLTRRIAYLIDERGVAPWNILAVTFTNKAAREMEQRVIDLIGDNFPQPLPGQRQRLGGLSIGTFHSTCARILRIEHEAIGYERNWLIYDTGDQLSLIRGVLQELNLDEKRYTPQSIQGRISNFKNELLIPEKVKTQTYFEEVAARVYRRYQEALQMNNAMDFDDLLMQVVLLLRRDTEILSKYQRKWQYILVDEFQDTNTAQYELVKLLADAPDGKRNLFGVGDEDQSIYRFRGADYRNVLQFRRDYPDARVVLLEQNYRSTQHILDAANAVISHNANRTPKALHTDNG